MRSVLLGSPIAREWLSSIANYPSSPCLQSGRRGAGSQSCDESPMGTPGLAHTGTDDFDTDLQDDENEEYKSLEIKKGPNIYSCSLHTNLNFRKSGMKCIGILISTLQITYVMNAVNHLH